MSSISLHKTNLIVSKIDEHLSFEIALFDMLVLFIRVGLYEFRKVFGGLLLYDCIGSYRGL